MQDALTQEASQATLQLRSQDNTEIVKLPNEIQDKCIEAMFRKAKKDHRRLMGNGARRPKIQTRLAPSSQNLYKGQRRHQVTQVREFILATLPLEIREKFKQTFQN